MSNIKLPVPITDLFAVFGMTEPAHVLILLLSSILGVLLLLILLIAVRGRPSGSELSHHKEKVGGTSAVEMLARDPVISGGTQPEKSNASTLQSPEKREMSYKAAEQVEDFQIFKRPKQKTPPEGRATPSLEANDQISTAEHLRLIEKEMVRLRDLYQGGHVTRDMYIDETRSLYHQARGLSSLS
jgi:hypothetical protein